MQFHTYPDAAGYIRKWRGGTLIECMKDALTMAAETSQATRQLTYVHQIYTENVWIERNRPYYKVYPTVIPLLTRLKLEFDSENLVLPEPHPFCIVFPEGAHDVHSILVGPKIDFAQFKVVDSSHPGAPGMCMYIDFGETYGGAEKLPILTWQNVPLVKEPLESLIGKNLTDSFHSVPESKVTTDHIRECMRIVASVCLIAQGGDEEIIDPDVLGKDRIHYDRADAERRAVIVDRAFRRRGPGWTIGRKYQPGGPYVVPPHPQLYWTGKGRTVPIIKTRKGYTVKRDQIVNVPSGYEGSDGKTTEG